MKTFPPSLLERIYLELETFAEEMDHPVAAFDADGTLWRVDIGELFFDFQIKSGALDLPADPWAHYRNLKIKSPEAAYLWLAQINNGSSIDEVRKWSKQNVDALDPLPTFDFQFKIIEKLQELKFEIFVVTASIAWAVEPAAALYGIPSERVLGVKTKIIDGRVTLEQDGVVTYKKGKVDAILEATKGRAPAFVSGNTEGDLLLLESSVGSRLVVASAPKDDSLFVTEQKMQEIAKLKGWHYFSFVD